MHQKTPRTCPRLLFAAPSSGSGKTVITCAVLELLKRRGLSCVSFKCGPDYIDPMFHQYVLNIPGYNLDSFFLSPEQVKLLFKEKTRNADIAVIEGVMGYYDGIGGTSTRASTYELAGITGTPVIFIIDGKKSSLSLAAVIRGFLDYLPDNHICGVILNRTSPMMAERLRPHLETLGVHLYGAVPECPQARWESRHLGLTLPGEQARLRENINRFADLAEQYLDIDGLLKLAENVPAPCPAPASTAHAPLLTDSALIPAKHTPSKTASAAPRRIAIARDETFCFYYQENLELLEQAGWELLPFSPLHDHKLPECSFSAILLGGGYPELYAKELSENTAMLEAIRTAKKQGIKILAECGGFLYLHEWLEGDDAVLYPMAGLIKANAFRTDKLSRFGYITLSDPQGTYIARAHEFHYWESTFPGTDWQAAKPLSTRKWNCMIADDTMLAGFPHLYYPSNPDWILSFLAGADHIFHP